MQKPNLQLLQACAAAVIIHKPNSYVRWQGTKDTLEMIRWQETEDTPEMISATVQVNSTNQLVETRK